MFLVNQPATFTGPAGATTVDIFRSDGTLLVDDGAVTNDQYTLAVGLNDQLDRLRLDWALPSGRQLTLEEIVGSLLFTVDQAQNKTLSGQQTPLASKTDAEIAAARQEVTEWFEQRTARSWIRRYCRVETAGTGTRILDLRSGHNRDTAGELVGGQGRFRDVANIISVSIGGTAQTVSDFKIDGGLLVHTGGSFPRGTISDPFNVVVEYAYGHNPVPLEATDNGIRLAMKLLVPSDVPSFAQSFSGGDATAVYPPGGFVLPSQVHQWLKRHQPVLIA